MFDLRLEPRTERSSATALVVPLIALAATLVSGTILFGLLGRSRLFLPRAGEFLNYWRLRDWLRLLGFEVEGGRFGCYRPAHRSQRWLERTAWIEAVGERWWPVLGAVYFLVAVKRLRGMRLVGLVRHEARTARAKNAAVANRHRPQPETVRETVRE